MPDIKPTDTIQFMYKFKFDNGTEKVFAVLLDAVTLELRSNKDLPKPEWTKLKYHQCEQCPLSDNVEHCPIAVNLSNLVDTFKDSASFENTCVTVETTERSYIKQTSLQKGLSSLIGMIMTTSGCPVMDKLRPMARFHLPFATTVETFYRAVSMYLTAQFFVMQKGKKPDWELKNLLEIYKAISKVNRGISQRLSNASSKDANVNAVVILHAFGEVLPYVIENGLAEIEYLFTEYIKRTDDVGKK